MFNYNLTSKPNFKVNKKAIDNIFEIICDNVNIPQKWTLNLIFLDNNGIQKLNKKYRKHDKTTDVLSFNYYNNFEDLNVSDIAWEIVFSENKIMSQGEEYKLWSEKEV